MDGGGYSAMEGNVPMSTGGGCGSSPSVSIRPGEDTMGGTLAGKARNYEQTSSQNPRHQHHQPTPSLPGATAGNGGVPKPIRRRMRMITSCLECRRRKLKCNKSNPCTNCVKFSRDCLYLGPKLDEASQLRLTEIKEKVGSLERQLERDVAKSGSRGFYHQRILADDVEGEFDEERDLEITLMVALDLTYEDDADGDDDVMDLGVQVGKMRLTEKIGGLNRPRISEEIRTGLSGGTPHMDAGMFTPGMVPPGSHPGSTTQQGPFSNTSSPNDSIPDFLRPSASYIPPTSGVFFGQIAQSPSLITFLPTKPAGDRLLEHYFEAVHPIARCIHRSSFETQYESFWEEVTAGYEPRASVQAVVFAAWFSAAVAMAEPVINREFSLTKATLIENMKVGTEVALSKANFLRTTRVETMQAFVMYMIPLCREEVSRAHSVLVGAAVRMAECMGLHRDGGKAYNLNPLETHVRRLIWHQLCFLDIRTCEAQGPKPTIRRDDYDTWLPDNCEEDQLTNLPYRPRPADSWTSTLLPLIRFEINEMMRIIWADRRKLEARRITLTQVLTKIENFRKRMLDNYDQFLDERIPLQKYARLVMHLLLYRLHVMILHPYYANTSNPMPQRLRSVLIMSGIMIIEIAIQLDTHPAFLPWRWYNGAYQQYQSSLILATEMFYHPTHKEANRIWTCLDYVFGLDCHLPNEEKGRRILTEIMGKMGIYMGMRKMRAPTWTVMANPAQQAVKTEEGRGGGCGGGGGGGGGGDTKPETLPSQQQQQAPQLQGDIQHPSMKEEPAMVLPTPESTQGPSFAVSSPGSALSPHHHHHMMSGSRPPPGPSSSQHNTPVPNIMMSSLWGLPHPPPPLNPDSPGTSSSDSGSVAGAAQRYGSATTTASILPPLVAVGGGSNSRSTAMASAVDGDWSNYQEDAINALFPYDPQTGNFAGFADPVAIGVVHNYNLGPVTVSSEARLM